MRPALLPAVATVWPPHRNTDDTRCTPCVAFLRAYCPSQTLSCPFPARFFTGRTVQRVGFCLNTNSDRSSVQSLGPRRGVVMLYPSWPSVLTLCSASLWPMGPPGPMPRRARALPAAGRALPGRRRMEQSWRRGSYFSSAAMAAGSFVPGGRRHRSAAFVSSVASYCGYRFVAMTRMPLLRSVIQPSPQKFWSYSSTTKKKILRWFEDCGAVKALQFQALYVFITKILR